MGIVDLDPNDLFRRRTFDCLLAIGFITEITTIETTGDFEFLFKWGRAKID